MKLHQENEVVWGTILLDLRGAGHESTESVQDSYGGVLVAWRVDTSVSEDHMFPQTWYPPTRQHDIMTQETTI